MKNFEKYKKEVYEAITLTNSDKLLVRAGIKFNPFVDNYRECKDRLFVWLFEEYQVPILDDVEKEYLSAVIKPFRKNVMDVVKTQYSGGKQSIRIRICAGDYAELPLFNNNTMYKGMEVGKYYTPEELGL